MQVYLINVRRNLCKFYDSTVEIEYLITDTTKLFFIKLKNYLSYQRLDLSCQ